MNDFEKFWEWVLNEVHDIAMTTETHHDLNWDIKAIPGLPKDGILKIGTELNDTIIQNILDANIHSLNISITNSINKGAYLLTTLLNDKNNTKDEAITEIYKMLRPGEPPTIEIATQIQG